MSFFREYLRQAGQQIDARFDEHDEALFVQALLRIRLGLPFRPLDPERAMPEKVPDEPKEREALHFVSAFLCFFVPKPPRYREEIDVFKTYFIPSFSVDGRKQEQLFQSVLPGFVETPLRQADWTSLDAYFRPEYRQGARFASA